MGINKEHKIKLIMEEEISLAREVALGVIIKKPLKAWLYMIPGMFIVDFLRRGKEIRRFSDHYMFPRKLAMETIQNDAEDKMEDNMLPEHERSIIARTTSLGLFSEELQNLYSSLLRAIIDHYRLLITAEGDTFADLVHNAYNDRSRYDAFIEKVLSIEKDIDDAITQRQQSPGERDRIRLAQEQLAVMRNKHAELFF